MAINKKGSILDFFYIMAMLFMTGICIFVAHIIINTADDTGVFADVEEAQAAVNVTKSTILNFDNMMLFIIIGLSLAVIVSAAAVMNHPATFIITFILLCIAVTVAGVVSNTFWTFADSSQISTTAAAFPKITFIFDRLPFYIAFMGLATMVAMTIGYNRQ